MAAMRDRLEAPVLVGVGAAFDFHAGLVPQAPRWMQSLGPRVGVPARSRSRAGCGGATCATTRASWPGSCASGWRTAAASLMSYDVAIIGCGRVGLPLALAFADRGLRTLGVDNDPERLAAVRDAPDALRGAGRRRGPAARRHRAGRERAADAAQADAIVLTLGTPSFSHIEIDMRDIRSVLDDLLPVLRPGHLLVLRSTIAPRHDRVRRGLPREAPRPRGRRATSSSPTSPSASPPGASSRRSARCRASSAASARPPGEAAGALFEPLGAPIVQTSPVEAELAKIWTNILRYAMFALPNRLMMECEQYDANVFEVIDLINRDYPRGGMPQPGFTAGTCLRKDFTFSEERSPAPGMLLAVSRVHESVPLFIVEGLKRRLGSLRGRKVAVLGLAFKADTDDERDSLSHKLIRLLERELADVAVHDPARAPRRRSPSRTRSSTPTRWSSRPTTASSAAARCWPRSPTAPRATPCWPIRGTASTPSRSSAGRPSWSPALRRSDDQRAPRTLCCVTVVACSASASQPEARQCAHRPNPVAPRDLLALGERAPVVGDRDFVEAYTRGSSGPWR